MAWKGLLEDTAFFGGLSLLGMTVRRVVLLGNRQRDEFICRIFLDKGGFEGAWVIMLEHNQHERDLQSLL